MALSKEKKLPRATIDFPKTTLYFEEKVIAISINTNPDMETFCYDCRNPCEFGKADCVCSSTYFKRFHHIEILVVKIIDPKLQIFEFSISEDIYMSEYDSRFDDLYALFEIHQESEKTIFSLECPSTGASQGYDPELQKLVKDYDLKKFMHPYVCVRTPNASQLTTQMYYLVEKYQEPPAKQELTENPHIDGKKNKSSKKK